MNLILCGMMGVGKTTVGIKLAEYTHRSWYDTDSVITEKYGKISDIFARYGEARFREIETETVKTLASTDNLVISVGGGLVLKQENNEILQKNGKIVYLRASVETLEKRLQGDSSRPLLQTEESLRERLEKLVQARAPSYEKAADYVVDVDGKTPEEIAAEIIALVEE